jgi:histone H3
MLEWSGRVARDMKSKTITPRHLLLGTESDEELSKLIKESGCRFAAGGVLPNIHYMIVKKQKKEHKKKTTRKPKEGQKLKHRYRPGTVSIKNIRREQKASNCVYFSKAAFKRFAKEIGQDFEQGQHYSHDAILALQMFIEQDLIRILQNANLEAIHAGRTRVQPKDIQMARRMCSNC